MEVEGERVKKTLKHHKINVINTKPKTRWYKTDLKKEIMAIEKIENGGTASTSPPKKGNTVVKTKSKRALIAPRKKTKKKTPKKSFGGSELKFNQMKILTQPMKISFMTDFFNSIAKNSSVPCHEKPPDSIYRSVLCIYRIDIEICIYDVMVI